MPVSLVVIARQARKFSALAARSTASTAARAMSVTETDVGIVVFTTEGMTGFHGIHKQRYSDFIVREVASDGSVVALLNTSAEQLEKSLFAVQEKPVEPTLKAVPSHELPETVAAGLLAISLSARPDAVPTAEMIDTKERLASYIGACIEGADDLPKELACFACNDKQTRTQMHQYTRKHLSAFMESSTVVINEDTVFVLIAKVKGAKSQQRHDRSPSWPPGVPDFLEFTLLKENIDTISAGAVISKHLRLKGSGMQFNGTKDKRGVTAQKCTVYRRRPSELARLNHGRFPIIRVGDFSYVEKPSRLGSLRGNRFSIVLRNVDICADDLVHVCEAVRARGFVNYYGLQRFGKGATASHDVGKAIYHKDFKAVVDSLFAPLETDRPEIAQAKRLYTTGEFAAAAKILPYSMHSERAVLESLIRNTSYSAAFEKVNRNTRLICTHAYQSFLFNLAATERVRRHGLKCVVGDIVKVRDSASVSEVSEVAKAMPDGAAVEGIADGDDDIAELKEEEFVQVHMLTEEDVARSAHGIEDVLLPLVGYDVVLPGNDIGAFYSAALARDRFDLEHFRTCLPQYRMPGSYRKLLQFPQDFTFAIASYEDPDVEISTTELSMMRSKDGRSVGSTYVATAAEAEGIIQNNIVSRALGGGETAQYKAAILNFTLSSGVYATMLIRELTKEDSSQVHQASLTASSSKRHAAENAGENAYEAGDSASKKAKQLE